MRRSIFIAGTAGIFLSGCARGAGATAYQDISGDGEPLRTAFNRDAHKVRILSLVSPTCGFCLEGTIKVQQAILDHEKSRGLAAYFVWVPELGAQSKDVPGGMALAPDKRARHYWDENEVLSIAYGKSLPTPGVAWDVYMLFPRGVRWDSPAPPKPVYWMHQLAGVTNAPHLDPDVLKTHVDGLLAG
jgi:hypothetical protein